MITQPTVLVLGAGASTRYGYPSGMRLKQQIVESLQKQDNSLYQILLGQRYDPVKITSFQTELARSGAASIDSFLEYRHEYIDMGKIAITFVLSKCEDVKKIFDNEEYWYGYLFRKLNTSFNNYGKNKISIITFNYDRSLEHYLFTVLKNFYGKTDLEVLQTLSLIPIIHVHGQIGYLPWQGGIPKRSYGDTINTNMIVECSKGIKIIHEPDLDKDPAFAQSYELLKNAEKIYFLGFGYHQENIDRLRIMDILRPIEISGTCMHYTEREREAIMAKVKNKINLNLFNISNQYILAFMRENIDFV